MFGEYQVRAALMATLNKAKAELGIDGFTVIARNPQNIARADNVILVDKLNTVRQGFQCRQYDKAQEEGTAQKVKEVMYWQEETTFQLSFCRARLITDNIGTFTSDDCLEKVMAWLDSRHGAQYMRSGKSGVPFAPVFVKNKRSRPYTDESDVHQMEESFDFRILVIQELVLEEHALVAIGLDTYTVDGGNVVKMSSVDFPVPDESDDSDDSD